MAKKQLTIRLDPEVLSWLHEMAGDRKQTVSELITQWSVTSWRSFEARRRNPPVGR